MQVYLDKAKALWVQYGPILTGFAKAHPIAAFFIGLALGAVFL